MAEQSVGNYEFHVTVDLSRHQLYVAEEHAERLGFKSSYIQGDPLLGNRSFFYYTGHTNSVESAMKLMERVGEPLPYGGMIIRKKIELIIYDTKTGVGM